MDITVADATALRDFYSAVVGLEPEHVKSAITTTFK